MADRFYRTRQDADELDAIRRALQEIVEASEPTFVPWCVIPIRLIENARAALNPAASLPQE